MAAPGFALRQFDHRDPDPAEELDDGWTYQQFVECNAPRGAIAQEPLYFFVKAIRAQ